MARQARKKSVRGGGSVFLRKDGRYEAKFKVEETGKYKSLYAPTEKEAYRLLEEARLQQKQGVLPTGAQQTVKQFLEYWLEDVQKLGVGLRTYVNARVVVHKYLVPGLGHIKLQKLTTPSLQSYYAKLLKQGLKASRVRYLNGVLHKALEHARRSRLISFNVAHDVQLPSARKRQPLVLDPGQAKVLMQKAGEWDLDALVALAVVLGMRKGEILALRWSDLDVVKGLLKIDSTVSYVVGHGFYEREPKTASSESVIRLPAFIVPLLEKHRQAQLAMQAQAGSKWADRGLIFCSKDGNFIREMTLHRRFKKLLTAAGLPDMHFHDLRHSAATILLGMGVPANVVQKLLRHANVKTTLGIYGHVLPFMDQEAVDKMDGLYG